MTHAKDAVCKCAAEHRPAYLDGEVHHVWPLGMGGPDVTANKVFLCPTAHTNAHMILRLMVRDRRPWTFRQAVDHFAHPVSRYAFQIALLGYRRWVNHALEEPRA